MDNSLFEKELRKKIQFDTAPVDTDQLWADINQKRRKKRPIIWFFLSGMATSLLFLFIIFPSHEASTKSNQSNMIPTKNSRANIIKENKTNNINTKLDTSHSIVASDSGNFDLHKSKSTQQSSKLKRSETNLMNEKNQSSGRLDQLQNNVLNKKVKTSKQEQSLSSISSQSEVVNSITSNHDGYIPNENPVSINSMKTNPISQELLTKINANKKTWVADFIDSRKLQPLAIQQMFNIDYKSIEQVKRVQFKTKKSNSGNFFFGLSSGYDKISRSSQIKLNHNSANWKFVNAYTEPISMLSVGLNLGFFINQKFYLKSGLSYHKLTEQVSHKWSTSRQVILPNQVISQIISAAGSTEVRGDVEVLETTEYDLNQYNNTTFLDIPIGIGYRGKPSNKGFFLNAEVGALFGFKTTQEGHVFKSSIELISLSEERTLKKNFGFGGYATLGLNKFLGERLSINLSLKGSTYVNDLSDDDYPHELKYVFYGIHLGGNFRF